MCVQVYASYVCVCLKGGRGGVYYVSFFAEDGLNHCSLICNVLRYRMTY